MVKKSQSAFGEGDAFTGGAFYQQILMGT